MQTSQATHVLIFFALSLVAIDCRRPTPSLAPPGINLLELEFLPSTAEVVLFLDADRGRRNPERDALKPLLKVPSVRRILDDFEAQLGLNLLTQVDQCAAAFSFRPGIDGSLALTATLHPGTVLDLTGLRDSAKKHSMPFVEEQNGNFSYYQTGDRSLVYWPNHRRLVWASGTWADFPRKKAQNLAATLASAHPEWATFWSDKNAVLRFAAHLPPPLRETLRTSGHGPAPGSILRVAGDFTLNHPTRIAFHFDLSNSPDARDLVGELEAFRAEAIQNPDLLYLGLGPHLEALSMTHQGARVSLVLGTTASELGEFIDRLVTRIRIP